MSTDAQETPSSSATPARRCLEAAGAAACSAALTAGSESAVFKAFDAIADGVHQRNLRVSFFYTHAPAACPAPSSHNLKSLIDNRFPI